MESQSPFKGAEGGSERKGEGEVGEREKLRIERMREMYLENESNLSLSLSKHNTHIYLPVYSSIDPSISYPPTNPPTYPSIHPWSKCVCVCMCVCVREGEEGGRERKRGRERKKKRGSGVRECRQVHRVVRG